MPPPAKPSGSSWALLWGFCLLVQCPVLKGHVTCLPPRHRPAGESGIDSLIMRSHCRRSARGFTPAAPLLWGFSGLLNVVYRAIKSGLLKAQSHWQVAAEWRQGVGMGAVLMAWELTPNRAGRPGGCSHSVGPLPLLMKGCTAASFIQN